MIKPELINAAVEHLVFAGDGTVQNRTPLYIDTGDGEPVIRSGHWNNTSRFNAIGSKSLYQQATRGRDVHYPVIDIQGVAELHGEEGEEGKRLRIRSTETTYHPRYNSDSFLRDVLSTHSIALEVFEPPRTNIGHDHKTHKSSVKGIDFPFIDLVLRAEEEGTFEVVHPESGDDSHSHVYIQREFSGADYQTLVAELGQLGLVSPGWQQLVEAEGMGIVSAPWAAEPVPVEARSLAPAA